MSYISILHNIAPLIGFVAILIGALAVTAPSKMSQGFGVPTGGTSLAYVVGLGIRDIFIGTTVLVMYFNSSWTSLSYISLMIAVVAASDFLVVLKHGDKQTSFVHLAGGIAATAYGLALYVS